MSTTIARTYETYGDALAASNALQGKGFGPRSVSLISKASNVSSRPADEIATEIASAGIPAEDVAGFASEVDGGKSLLVVRAGFGMAVKAMKIVDAHHPVDGHSYHVASFEMKTPASTSTSTSVASSAFFLSSFFNFPLLINSATPFSDLFKWPTLINDPAPLSRMLNWPTLSKRYTFAEPKITNAYTFGEPKLKNSPTVLSDALNVPVLLKDGQEK